MANVTLVPVEEESAVLIPVDEPQVVQPETPKSGIIRRAVGDTAISLLKGAIGVPESVVGLADIVTGGYAGKAAESIGYKPKEAKEILDTLYSPEQQAANREVSEAKGFVPTLKAAAQNPSTIVQTVAESAPSMIGGAGIARGIIKAAPKVAPLITGAIGEGAVTAGQTAEAARQNSKTGLLTAKQAIASVGAGALTGAIGVGGGKIAQKLGIADIDTMLASGKISESNHSLLRRVAEGTFSEGVLEELPQSAQEQVWQNVANDKPWNEGVLESAAMGMIAGGVMGGGGNILSSQPKTDINLIKGTDERSEIAAALREQSKPIASPAPVEQRPPEPIMDSEAATPEDQEIMAMQQENELYRQQQLMDKADIPVVQEKEPEIPTSFRSADGKSNVRTKRLDDGTYEVSTTSVDEYGNKKTFAKQMTAKEADEHINKLMPEPTRDEYLKVNAPEVKEEVAQPELPVAEPANPDVATFQPILDQLTAQTGVQVNKSDKGFSTTSDFQVALKEGWPTVRKGIELGSFEKSEVIKALKNITEGKRLGAAQQRVIDAFREDIARYEEVTAEQQNQDAAVEAKLQAERDAMQEEGGNTSFEFRENETEDFKAFSDRRNRVLSDERDYYASLSRDELYEEAKRLRAEEDGLEERILGADLDAWNRAQRQLNSRNDEIVDKAEKEIERIESKLSQADRKKLYGEGEVGHSAADIKEYVNAVDAIFGDTADELAASLRFAITKLNGKTDPKGMDPQEFTGYLQLQEGMKQAQSKGWDTKELSDKVMSAAASRFADPEDALFMLKSFIKSPTAKAPQTKLFPTPPTFGKKPQGKGSVSENPMLTEMGEREAESKQETISFSQNTGGANGRSFEGKVVGANSTSASKQLEDALSKDGFNIARGSYEQLEVVGEDAEALQALTASLGRELVFIRRTPNGRLRNTPNPFAMSDGRTIYINYENNKQLLFLLGHELTHTIARSDPEVYAKLKQVVVKYTDMAGAKRSYLASNMLYRNVSEDLVTEEVVGNLMGEYFNDPKFWKEVAKDKSFFEKMRSIVEAVLEKASEILNGYTAHFVKDIDAVRKAMAEAVVESAKSQSKSGGQVRFAQTVPDTTKERSDDDMRGISERDADLVQPSDGQAMGASPSAQADRISEAKQRAHSVLDSLKAFVNNPGGLGTLPMQRAYLADRLLTKGKIGAIKGEQSEWFNAFPGATKEEKESIYQFLTTKDAEASTVPEKFRQKAVEGKQMVIDIGQKSVDYGTISEASFDKRKGEYLPNVYLKFLLGNDTARVMGTGKKIDGSYGMARDDSIPEDVKRLILGQIKDPGYLLAKAFSIPSRDMALIDWLATISKNEQWVMPESLIEWSIDGSASRNLGRINYLKNSDGTYNLTITEVKTIETKHPGIKKADLQTFLGNDKIAAYIAAGKGKPVLRKTEVNGKAVYKPTPWKKVGRIQYKTEPDGTMTFKLKERVTSKKTHDNVTDSQLDQLAGKRADGIRAGEGRAENSQVMTPWHLAAEAKRLQKQIDYMPAEDRKEAEEMVRRMRQTADKALENLPIKSTDVPDNFRQMPDSPKYGALRGLIVRKEVFGDIVGVVNVSIGERSLPEKIMGDNGVLAKLNRLWKWSKVILSVPAWFRNMGSNMIALHLSGVNPIMVPVRMTQAAHEIMVASSTWPIIKKGLSPAVIKKIEKVANGSKHWKEALKHGIKEGTFSNTELVRMNEELIRIYTSGNYSFENMMRWLQYVGSVLVNKTGDFYQFLEYLSKTAKIIDEMSIKRWRDEEGREIPWYEAKRYVVNGKNINTYRVATGSEAAMEADHWLLDYSLVHPGIRYLRNIPLGIPFITYMTKMLPRLLEAAIKRPWQYTPYVAIAWGLPYWIAGMLDIDDDDYEKIKKAMPEWIANKQHVYILPVRDKHGRWQALDLGYYFPWTQWTTMSEGVYDILSGGNVKDASAKIGQGVSVGGPLSDLIAAWKTGIDPFTQRKIVDEYAEPSEQLAQRLAYLYHMAMPPWLTNRGTAGKMYSALTNKLDKNGVPKSTVTQAALSLVGANIYAYDTNLTRTQNIERIKYAIAEQRRKIKSQLSDPNLTETDKEELREKAKTRIQKMNNELLKYAKSSMPSQKELLKRETQ